MPLDFSANAATASITAGQGSQTNTRRAPRIGASSTADKARNAGCTTVTTASVAALMAGASGKAHSLGKVTSQGKSAFSARHKAVSTISAHQGRRAGSIATLGEDRNDAAGAVMSGCALSVLAPAP